MRQLRQCRSPPEQWDFDTPHQEVKSTSPALNPSWPMAQSDQQNAEVILCNFRGRAFRAPAFTAWNTPSYKPAAR